MVNKAAAADTSDRSDTPTPAQGTAAPSIAVIIGSIGVKAFAALPFLQLLSAKRIPVDLIVGTGGGGLLAALWSAGFDLDQMQRIFSNIYNKDAFEEVDSESLMAIMKKGGKFSIASGLYRSSSLRKAYSAIFKDMRLETLTPRTLLCACDIRTGESVVLDQGNIAQAVEACGAIYPIHPPVAWGYQLLADGSSLSPLPVMEALKRNADIILVIYLNDMLDEKPKNFLECYLNMKRIGIRSLQKAQFFSAIDMHNYEIIFTEVNISKTIHPWSVDYIPEILFCGKIAAQDKIKELQIIIKQFNNNDKNFTFGKA